MLSSLVSTLRAPRALLVSVIVLGCGICLTTWTHIGWLPAVDNKWSDIHYTAARCTPGTSAFLGGDPGFSVLENVWFRGDTFYVNSPDTKQFPVQDAVVTAKNFVVEKTVPKDRRPQVCFSGTTLFTNEGSDWQWNGLWHYYHFAAENVLTGFAALGSVNPTSTTPPVIDRFVIPWLSNWHDQYGLNDVLVDSIFPELVDEHQWKRLSKDDRWVFFEKIVIIDRWAAHKHTPAADVWIKMAVGLLTKPLQSNFFSSARQRFMRYNSISDRRPGDKQRILYVDRQSTTRRLPDEKHEALLAALRGLAGPKVEFVHLVLENLDKVQQMAAFVDATIAIGIHGNGLTHLMWMPEKSAVIEFFPDDTFLRDYETIATALGHKYYAICNDTHLTPEMWNARPGGRNPELLHDGTVVNLQLPILMGILRDLLD